MKEGCETYTISNPSFLCEKLNLNLHLKLSSLKLCCGMRFPPYLTSPFPFQKTEHFHTLKSAHFQKISTVRKPNPFSDKNSARETFLRFGVKGKDKGKERR